MISTVLLKINDFLNLQPGWCYGEGIPPSRHTAQLAAQVAIHLLAYGFHKMNAFPGLEGEIRVTAYTSADYFEFTVGNAEKINYLHEIGGVEADYQEEINLADCRDIIRDLDPLCDWYEPSTQSIMTPILKDSKVLPLPQPPIKASPFLNVSALSPAVALCASTSPPFMAKSVAFPLFFGLSTPPFCLQTA